MDVSKLLDLPLEVRLSIYSCFIRPKQSGEEPSSKRDHKQIDFTILQICRQIREEVLDFYIAPKSWMICSSSQSKISFAAGVKNEVLCLPDILVPTKQVKSLISGASLSFTLVANNKPRDHNLVYVVVPFNEYAVIHVLMVLWRHEVRSSGLLDVHIPTDTGRRQLPEMVLPLTMLCGYTNIQIQSQLAESLHECVNSAVKKRPNTVRDFQEYMLALKEQGNCYYRNGHRLLSALLYIRASDVMLEAERLAETLALDRSHPELNALRAIHIDICNNYALTMNHFNDYHRTELGSVRPREYGNLVMPILKAAEALQWLGASERQRSKGHLYRGKAYSNLADFLAFPQNRDHAEREVDGPRMQPLENTQTYLQCARDDFYYAWKMTNNVQAQQSYYSVMKRHDLPPTTATIQEIAISKDVTWRRTCPMPTLLPSVVSVRDLKSLLLKAQVCEIKVSSTDEIRRTAERCGILGDSVEGFVRLLRYGLNRETTTG